MRLPVRVALLAVALVSIAFGQGSLAVRCEGVDDTAAIQKHLNEHTSVVLTGTCVIRQTLVIDSDLDEQNYATLSGVGSTSILRADYAGWRGSDLAVLRLKGDKANHHAFTGIEQVRQFNRSFRDLTFQALSAGDRPTIAIAIGNLSSDFDPSKAIAYASLLNGQIENLSIVGFDTALDITEAWQTGFRKISIDDCRIGINVHGKSANDAFDQIYFTNPRARGIGMILGTRKYLDRIIAGAEGIVITNSLFFGGAPNLDIREGLHIIVKHNIVDGPQSDNILIGNPDQAIIDGNYISSTGVRVGIRLGSPITAADGILITNNYFLGGDGTGTGIANTAGGTGRTGLQIVGNRFSRLGVGIRLENVPRESNIENNFASGLTGSFIVLRNGGGRNTEISGNKSADRHSVLDCPQRSETRRANNFNRDGSAGSCR
jgi:hypothetical protein